MSWTDADTIKLHLQAFSVDSLVVRFLPVRIEGTDPLQLPHGALDASGFTLQAMHALTPDGPETLQFSGTTWASLGASSILPHSLVLAKASDIADRFAEGVDYLVDEELGRVKRIAGGGISEGVDILAWYLPLVSYEEGVDYDIDLARGRIKRLPAGSIPDPANLLVSYSTAETGATDELVGQTISEAETKILDRLKEGYDGSSTDEGLTIGATELVLAMLCDDLALRALTAVGDSSADDRAHRFLDLARRYEARAVSTLSRYLHLPLPAVSTRQANTPAASGW